MTVSVPHPPIFGRAHELAVVRGIAATSDSGAGVLLVRGDPGSGKSTLLNEAARLAGAANRLVLRASGVETEMRMPFAGLHQLLHTKLDELAALPEPHRRVLTAALDSVEVSSEAFVVGVAVLHLLDDLTSREPVMLIVDDMQWLDSVTLDVLGFLARRLEDEPVGLIASARTGFTEQLGAPIMVEIDLKPLSAAVATELVDTRFPTLPCALRQRVVELAGGNPLALVELPKALLETPCESGSDDLPLTRRLERAFAGRVERLPARTQILLRTAAFSDARSLREILMAASELANADLDLRDLAAAEAEQLVSAAGDAFAFHHPLIPSAIRAAARSAERQAIHAALANAIQDPDRSTLHRAAAAVSPDEPTAEQLDATAAHLRGRREDRLAVDALVRAAELSATPAGRSERLVGAAEAALELGRLTDVERLLDAAERSGQDIPHTTRHIIRWLRAVLAEPSGSESVEAMVHVAIEFAADGEVARAWQALTTAAHRCYNFRVGERTMELVCTSAERLPAAADDPRLLVVLALASPPRNERRVLDVMRSITPDRFPARADPDDPSLCLHLYALSATALAQFQVGLPFQIAAILGLRAEGRLGLLCRALASHGYERLVTDDWRGAEQAAAECLQLIGYAPGTGQPHPESVDVLNVGAALAVLGTVAANRGDLERAEALIEESVHVHGAASGSFCSAQTQAARAALALSSGRPLEAFQHVARIFDPADPAWHWGISHWRTVLRDLADAAVLSGNAAAARRIVERVAPADTTEEFLGTMAHVNAVLADGDDEARFRHAQDVLRGGAYSRARLDLAFGLWLRRARRAMDARPPLRAAADGFDAMGAVTWAARARQELRASGENVRSRSVEHRDELSPQEAQIAQLAADGLTNREIAERLFLSHRTVGSHLYRIFPKLGITSRSELRNSLDDSRAGHAPGGQR